MTETINQINMVIQALNKIETSGKQNLLNLGASIDILENIARELGAKAQETKSGEAAPTETE